MPFENSSHTESEEVLAGCGKFFSLVSLLKDCNYARTTYKSATILGG